MKTERLHRVRSVLYGQPWMITEDWHDQLCAIYERNLEGLPEMSFRQEVRDLELDEKGYNVRDGVAIVPLMGPIFPYANLLTKMSGATSVAEFSDNYRAALEDADVQSVILRIHSPGGSVERVFETASQIFAARSHPKVTVALADSTAASAAYAIGSQADMFYTTEAGRVGSIGVILRVDNNQRQLLNEGIDPLILRTGKYKAIGNGPVTDEQRAVLEGMMQDYFGRFKDAVMRARPEVDIEKASTGEMWIGQKAVDMKLVDGITTLDALIAELGSKNT